MVEKVEITKLASALLAKPIERRAKIQSVSVQAEKVLPKSFLHARNRTLPAE
jgi:hypothetical protein